MMMKITITHRHRIPPRQFFDVTRQLIGGRHRGIADQQRNQADVLAGQRGSDFQAHKIMRVLQPPFAVFIFCQQPQFTDYHQHNIAGADGILNAPDPVFARLNRVDVHENRVTPKMRSQAIIQPACITCTIHSPVTDKNA